MTTRHHNGHRRHHRPSQQVEVILISPLSFRADPQNNAETVRPVSHLAGGAHWPRTLCPSCRYTSPQVWRPQVHRRGLASSHRWCGVHCRTDTGYPCPGLAAKIVEVERGRVSPRICLTGPGLTCSPYNRATFRYTPLLPLVLSPSLLHPLAGKIVLSLISLSIPVLLLRGPRPAGYWATHLLWTLNPFVLNITTRGSPEATIVFFVVLALYFLRKSDQGTNPTKATWEILAAMSWAIGVSWKIYPIIYGISIWTHLSSRYGYFGWPVWRFGIVALTSFIVLNGALWSM